MICDIIPTIMDLKHVRVRLEKERAHRRELAHRLRRNESDPVEAAELSKVDQHPGGRGGDRRRRSGLAMEPHPARSGRRAYPLRRCPPAYRPASVPRWFGWPP